MSQCKNCRFSRKRMQMGRVQLLCMFDPPKNVPIPQPNGAIMFIAIWQSLEDDAWCGKYEVDPQSRN